MLANAPRLYDVLRSESRRVREAACRIAAVVRCAEAKRRHGAQQREPRGVVQDAVAKRRHFAQRIGIIRSFCVAIAEQKFGRRNFSYLEL